MRCKIRKVLAGKDEGWVKLFTISKETQINIEKVKQIRRKCGLWHADTVLLKAWFSVCSNTEFQNIDSLYLLGSRF